ncbi:hypothetical protein SDC9_149571 [bioreactor metagenome]|uniref:Uncharacterized protein n=1 Tax=bioreactor metagenome TaxID=1076179 RepID=A0A645EJZ2_9ZZZZ
MPPVAATVTGFPDQRIFGKLPEQRLGVGNRNRVFEFAARKTAGRALERQKGAAPGNPDPDRQPVLTRQVPLNHRGSTNRLPPQCRIDQKLALDFTAHEATSCIAIRKYFSINIPFVSGNVKFRSVYYAPRTQHEFNRYSFNHRWPAGSRAVDGGTTCSAVCRASRRAAPGGRRQRRPSGPQPWRGRTDHSAAARFPAAR